MSKSLTALLVSASVSIPSVAFAEPAPRAAGGKAAKTHVQSQPTGTNRGTVISRAAQSEAGLETLDDPPPEDCVGGPDTLEGGIGNC